MRVSYVYISFSCALIVSYLEAKSFSLNDAIAAEQLSQNRYLESRTAPDISSESVDPPSKDFQSPEIVNNKKLKYNKYPQNKKTSLLKYKKTFQIKSPSKPKKLKYLQKPRLKRKNLTTKRETPQNEKIYQKYIPLLKNLELLFDNILGSDSSEAIDPRRYKYKRNPINYNEEDDLECTCAVKSDPDFKSHTQQTTIIPSLATEVENETPGPTTAATTPTDNIANDNISGFRWNKNIPILLTRDSDSVRRNDNRFRKGGDTTSDGSSEGHLTGTRGNYERFASFRKTQPDTENNENNSNGDSRNSPSSDGSSGGRIQDAENHWKSEIDRRLFKTNKFIFPTNETFEGLTRNISKHEGQTEFEIRRNKTESPLLLSKFNTRGFDSKEERPLRTTQVDEESHTLNKQLSDRNGPTTAKNQKIRGADKTITSKLPKLAVSNSTFPGGKVVMIFDGYSVAKDVNGENKLSEKAIRIHTQ